MASFNENYEVKGGIDMTEGLGGFATGAILGGLGWYKYLIDFAGCGATVPLTGFGNLLAKGTITEISSSGLIGAFTGGTKAAAGGIASAIFFGYIASLVSKPKIKKQ